MSAKIQLGSILGSLVLLVIISIVVITGSKANEDAAIAAKISSQNAEIEANHVNKTLTDFVERWDKRIATSNKVNNSTQDKIEKGVEDIIGNLTRHRVISNMSNANQSEILNHVLNATHALTSQQYSEEAEKKVASIIGNMTAEHEIIMKGLNISKSDHKTQASDEIQKLKKALEVLEQREKGLPPGLAKK